MGILFRCFHGYINVHVYVNDGSFVKI